MKNCVDSGLPVLRIFVLLHDLKSVLSRLEPLITALHPGDNFHKLVLA